MLHSASAFLFTPSTKRKELIWKANILSDAYTPSMCRAVVHLFESTFNTHSDVEGNT